MDPESKGRVDVEVKDRAWRLISALPPLPSRPGEFTLRSLHDSAALKHPLCAEVQPAAWPPANTGTHGCNDQNEVKAARCGRQWSGLQSPRATASWVALSGALVLPCSLSECSRPPHQRGKDHAQVGQRLGEGKHLPWVSTLGSGGSPGRCSAPHSHFLHSHFSD